MGLPGLCSAPGRRSLDQRSAASFEAARRWPADTRKPQGLSTSGGAAALAVPPQLVALNLRLIDERDGWFKRCGRRTTKRCAIRCSAR